MFSRIGDFQQTFDYIISRLPFSCYTEILICNFGKLEDVKVVQSSFEKADFLRSER